jgi:hypothetical protein
VKIEQSKHVVFPVEKEKCYLTIFGSDNSRLIPGQIYIYIYILEIRLCVDIMLDCKGNHCRSIPFLYS